MVVAELPTSVMLCSGSAGTAGSKKVTRSKEAAGERKVSEVTR